eukprot:6180533-Pleurochrysis_carterae.AAC.2
MSGNSNLTQRERCREDREEGCRLMVWKSEEKSCLRKIGFERQEVVVVSGDVESVLLPPAVLLDPLEDLRDRVVHIEHRTEHVVHVVSVRCPVDVALLVHEEEAIFVLAQKVDGGTYQLGHLGDCGELILSVLMAETVRGDQVDNVAVLLNGLNRLLHRVRVGRVDAAVGHVAPAVWEAAHQLVTVVGVELRGGGDGLGGRHAGLIAQHRPPSVRAVCDLALVVDVVLDAEPAARVVAARASADGDGGVDSLHHGALHLRTVVPVVRVRDEGRRGRVQHGYRGDHASRLSCAPKGKRKFQCPHSKRQLKWR